MNVSLNWRRARHPTEPWDEEHAEAPSDAASPEAIVLLRLEMREALDQLSPDRRAVLRIE